MYESGGGVVTEARSAREQADCPGCGSTSARVHSRYQRRLADAALGNRPVVIRLQVRRFTCAEPGCERSTFVEQVPSPDHAARPGTARRFGPH